MTALTFVQTGRHGRAEKELRGGKTEIARALENALGFLQVLQPCPCFSIRRGELFRSNRIKKSANRRFFKKSFDGIAI